MLRKEIRQKSCHDVCFVIFLFSPKTIEEEEKKRIVYICFLSTHILQISTHLGIEYANYQNYS